MPAPCENELIQTKAYFNKGVVMKNQLNSLYLRVACIDRQQLKLLLLLLSLGLLAVGAGAPLGGGEGGSGGGG